VFYSNFAKHLSIPKRVCKDVVDLIFAVDSSRMSLVLDLSVVIASAVLGVFYWYFFLNEVRLP
jgi:hypothetical protein